MFQLSHDIKSNLTQFCGKSDLAQNNSAEEVWNGIRFLFFDQWPFPSDPTAVNFNGKK